jgi:hypothetical protein
MAEKNYCKQVITADRTPPISVQMEKTDVIGHVIKMDQTRVAKKIFENRSEGRRKVVRPKLRWLEKVENDLKEKKVKRQRQMSK